MATAGPLRLAAAPLGGSRHLPTDQKVAGGFSAESLFQLTGASSGLTAGVGGGKLATRMARKLRVQYPGAIYHVMSRGDRREAIFIDDEDRHLFLETLSQATEKTDWQVHAWCLMSNHFHLVSETPRGNLVAGMQASVNP
jgi:hypothetical protein